MNQSLEDIENELRVNDYKIDRMLNNRYTKLYELCTELKNGTGIKDIEFVCNGDHCDGVRRFMYMSINNIAIFEDDPWESHTINDLKNISDLQKLNLTVEQYEIILYLIRYCYSNLDYNNVRSPFDNLCSTY